MEETQREFQTELQKLEGEKKLLENTILNQSKSNSSDNETEKISLEEKVRIIISKSSKLETIFFHDLSTMQGLVIYMKFIIFTGRNRKD